MKGTATVARVSSNRMPLLVFCIVIAVIGTLLILLFLGLQREGAGAISTGNAPDFTLTTFDGQEVALAGLRGKPVIINFWASWCIPCRDEAPALQRAWLENRAEGLLVLGVDYVDTEPEAKKFMSDFGQTYPNGPDFGTRISQAYHISGVPETYFITREGKLLPGIDSQGHPNGNWIGPVPAEALNARIRLLTVP